jgi:hypothetical protein
MFLMLIGIGLLMGHSVGLVDIYEIKQSRRRLVVQVRRDIEMLMDHRLQNHLLFP